MYTPADLALAQRHVDEGESRVAGQEERIGWLAAYGHDTVQAEDLLRIMRETLAQMRLHRDLIAAEMGRVEAAHVSN